MIDATNIKPGQKIRLMTTDEIEETLGYIPGWIVGSMNGFLGLEVTVKSVDGYRIIKTNIGDARVARFTIKESYICYVWLTEIVKDFFYTSNFDVDTSELDRFLGGFHD